MYVGVWYTLVAAGVLCSISAFYTKRAAAASATANVFIWLVVAYGSTHLEVTSGGEVFETDAMPMVPLALALAAISIFVAVSAWFGDYGTDDSGLDSAAPGAELGRGTDRRQF